MLINPTPLGVHCTLVDAILEGDNATIEKLLPKANVRYNNDELLIACSRTGNIELLKRLIELGCHLSSRNWEVLSGKEKVLKWLLKEGKLTADCIEVITPKVIKLFLPYDNFCIASSTMLKTAIKHDSLETTRIITMFCDEPLDKGFAVAAELGHPGIFRLLWAYCDLQPRILISAVRNNYLWMVKSVLPYFTDSRVICRALGDAVNWYNMSKLLLPYCNPKENDSEAFRDAALMNNFRIVRLLLPHSSPLIRGSIALRKASGYGYLEIVKLLMPYSNVPIYDNYALKSAVINGYLDVAKLLLPYSKSRERRGTSETAAEQLEVIFHERWRAHSAF